MSQERKKNLNKSQEALAEAARESNANNSGVDELALTPLITAETAAGTSKLLNTPSDISKVVNSPLAQNTNRATDAISRAGRIANASPIKTPVLSSLFSPLFMYSIANEVTGGLRDDGRDLNTLIGEGIGGALGRAMYGDGSQPAITEQERQAMQDGLNVNKPIIELAGSRNQRKPTVVGYEPLAPKSEEELNKKRMEDIGGQFEAAYQMPDGTFEGRLRDGTKRPMTKEELEAMEYSQTVGGLKTTDKFGTHISPPLGDYQSVSDGRGGMGSVRLPEGQVAPMTKEEYIKQYAALQNAARDSVFKDFDGADEKARRDLQDRYFGQQEPKVEGTGMSPVADKMLADFQRFKDSGREMTAQQRATAEALAMSTGRVFDPETGYSREFDPEILEEYNTRVSDGRIDPLSLGRQDSKSSLDLATEERREAQAQSNLEFEANRGRMEDERNIRQESGGLTISVDGKQVPATEENREKRDLETRLKEEARSEGLSEAGVRDYVRQGVEGERSAQEEKLEADRKVEVQKIMDELNIETAEADLELKRRRLLPDAPERPSASSIASFVDTAENDFDLKFDPKTFTFETVEDGGLFSFDSQHPLNPNSNLYNRLSQMEGSEYFLSPPVDVMNILEQSTENAKQSPTGFVPVQADDGRVYTITAGGEVNHVGYSSEKIK